MNIYGLIVKHNGKDAESQLAKYSCLWTGEHLEDS